MNAASADEDFSEIHEPHWVLRGAFQLLVFGLVLAETVLAVTVQHGLIWLTSCLSRHRARLRILAIIANDYTPLEAVSGCIYRAKLGIVLFPIPFPASFFVFPFAGPKQTRSPARLGRVGADNCGVGFRPLDNRDIWSVAVFHLDVSRSSYSGG